MRWTVKTLGKQAVVLGLLAALFGFAAPAAVAAQAPAAAVAWHQTDGPAYQGEWHTAATPDPGPSINQKAKDADAAQAQRKLILGVICVLLLAIVYYGGRRRRKHRRRLRNLQNAKA